MSKLYTNVDPKKSIELSNETITISKKLDAKNEIGYSLLNIGTAYRYMNNMDSAFFYYSKAITYFEEINNIKVRRYTAGKLIYKFSALAYTVPVYHWLIKNKI